MANKGAATLIYTSADLSTQHVQYQAEIQSKPGLTWGIPSIDQHVLPMRGGNVALIVARPGHAKTATLSYLALTESTRIIERGKQDEEVVVFVTLENAVDDIYAALMAARSNAYTASDYYWGRVDLGVVEQNATQRGVLPLNMIGLSTMRQTEEVLNLDTIFECVEAISTGRDSAGTRVPQRKVTLLLIDYLQLIEVPGAHDKVDTVGRAIVGCKKLGIKYNVPSFLAAQASRDVDSYNVKIPMEKDVQWSCLPGGSIIVNAETGEPVLAKDVYSIVNSGVWFPVHSMDDMMKISISHICNAKKNSESPIYQLSCEMRESIRATADHRFLTPTGWKKMRRLSIGDFIAVSSSMPVMDSGSDISCDRAMLVGLMLGDGMLKRKMLLFTNSDDCLLDLFNGIVESEWPELTTNKKKQSKWETYDVTVVRRDGRRYPGCNPALSWFKSIGLIGQEAKTKAVPNIKFSNAAVSSLLAGLFVTDGSVYMDAYNNARISFATASGVLAHQVKRLLLRLGIYSFISTIERQSTMYVVSISQCDVEKFMNVIDMPGRKGELLKKWLVRRKNNSPRSCYGDMLPEEWNMDAINIVKMFDLRSKYNNVKGRTITRDRMAQIANETLDPTLMMYADCDIRWVRILSIEKLESEETFDFSVPGDENFVADGFIVHNSSGEQAADKVFGLWMPWKTEPVHNLRDGQIPTVNVYGRDYPISPRTLFVEMRKQRGEAARRLWCMDIRPELLTLADGERDIDRIELGYAYE